MQVSGGERQAPRPCFKCGAPPKTTSNPQTADSSGYCAKRLAESASSARACRMLRNCLVWPMKSPSAVKLLIVATAPPNLSVSGRMIETLGRPGLNSQGTGKIRLGWIEGFSGLKKLGNVRPDMVSVNGATGACTPLPAKSTHSKK